MLRIWIGTVVIPALLLLYAALSAAYSSISAGMVNVPIQIRITGSPPLQGDESRRGDLGGFL